MILGITLLLLTDLLADNILSSAFLLFMLTYILMAAQPFCFESFYEL